MYTPETSCMKKTSVRVKNTSIKQLCSQKVWDVATAFRAREAFRCLRETGPDIYFILHDRLWYWRSAINSVKWQELTSHVFKRIRITFILSAGKRKNSDCDNLFIVLHKYIFYFAGTNFCDCKRLFFAHGWVTSMSLEGTRVSVDSAHSLTPF